MVSMLDVRKAIKKRKPDFNLRNANSKKRRHIGKWRRPKGRHNKIRLNRGGHPIHVTTGYGSPKEVSGFSSEGVLPVVVRNLKDLEAIKGDVGIVIASNVGLKKKNELIKKAAEKKIKLLNVKADEFAKTFTDLMGSRKSLRKKLIEKRKARGEAKKEKKVAETKKSTEGKKGIEGKISEVDSAKKAEKTEKDKIITKAK
jgi:large subunit ribosomal protein L32e